MSLAVVEPFVKGAEAIRRHTELARLLREAGWQPVHDSALHSTAA